MDFVYTHEDPSLVHWYANWRKWPAIYNSWRKLHHDLVWLYLLLRPRKAFYPVNDGLKENIPRKQFSAFWNGICMIPRRMKGKGQNWFEVVFWMTLAKLCQLSWKETRTTWSMKRFFSGILELWMKMEMCVHKNSCIPS